MTIAVVLGNRNNDNGTLSSIALERMALTLQLLQQQQIDKLILSGGMANITSGATEAQLMQQYLVTHGVDNSQILLEDKSTTTATNAKYCAPIVNNLHPSKVVLVTSAEHMDRKMLNPLKLLAKYLDKHIQLVGYKGDTL